MISKPLVPFLVLLALARVGAEWIMFQGKIPVADYRAFARDFTAAKFDPDVSVAALEFDGPIEARIAAPLATDTGASGALADPSKSPPPK